MRVARFVAAGVAVAVGHTSATFEQARVAFDAGASILTHAFNGMPPLLHRAPGPVGAAIAAGATLELINDGVHVHPEVARILFAAAPGRVALVTDAMEAAGIGDGRYGLAGRAVTVKDGVARLDDGGSIAGSTLTLDAAVRHAVDDVGISVADAIAAVTSVPAAAIGRAARPRRTRTRVRRRRGAARRRTDRGGGLGGRRSAAQAAGSCEIRTMLPDGSRKAQSRA